eukprot:TRINITY_DN36672_c0_g1_i1.p1 TRINITY_DN36672_c0_g1~~TRINITY_DN36672_c0_g1_i1.p1  ORF type:complete len:485 (+),score=113.09 TRINITY_DN36672_c0_g1_i1:62-1456(+)
MGRPRAATLLSRWWSFPGGSGLVRQPFVGSLAASRRGFSGSPLDALLPKKKPPSKEVRETGVTLRKLAGHHREETNKYNLQELIDLHGLPASERFEHVHAALDEGISKVILILQDLPLGFSAVEPIREVIRDYVHDLQDLRQTPPCQFPEVAARIFDRHRSVMKQISKGLRQFQAGISKEFQEYADFVPSQCENLADTVPAIRRIEQGMDEFFTLRTTLRLLIYHSLRLSSLSEGEASSIASIAWDTARFNQAAQDLRNITGQGDVEHIGAVCLHTKPAVILREAYRQTSFMCERDYGRVPRLLINGMDSEEYFERRQHLEDTSFPYIDLHLYYIFFEVLKNALATSIRKAGEIGEVQPVSVTLMSGSSLMSENERTIKIADCGEGMSRSELIKAWSYFYSTKGAAYEASKVQAPKEGDFSLTSPLANGRGLGLPISRVLARYFGGEIDIHSIPRRGTDVYLYL